jgi:hypothetical protein
MWTSTQIAIAVPIVVLIGVVLWRTAEALQQRGMGVRPVTMMSRLMTRVEEQHARKQQAERADNSPPEQDT